MVGTIIKKKREREKNEPSGKGETTKKYITERYKDGD